VGNRRAHGCRGIGGVHGNGKWKVSSHALTNLPDPLQSQHRYTPNAEEDVGEMLGAIGIDSIDRLFESIPAGVKLDRLLDIAGPWSEIESRRYFRELASRNKTAVDHLSFLGAGAYAHFQPAC